MKKRSIYTAGFIVLLLVEVLIAIYVNDNFVRPYIGDVLVVVVIYLFVKMIFPNLTKWLPLYVFIFAAVVEILQYFHIVELLGLQDNTFFRVLIGSVFDVKDIICYGVGCMAIALVSRILEVRSKK